MDTHEGDAQDQAQKTKKIIFESDVGVKLTPELAEKKGLSIYGEDHNDQGDDQNDDQNDENDYKDNKIH